MMSFEEARAWDCNPANCYNCAECHHNIGASDWQGAYPCGQWHCWVMLNTEGGEEE